MVIKDILKLCVFFLEFAENERNSKAVANNWFSNDDFEKKIKFVLKVLVVLTDCSEIVFVVLAKQKGVFFSLFTSRLCHLLVL